jgi:hypothetical protein
MSSYNPAIPQASNFQDNSQAQILSNFGSLDTTFAIEHTKFSDTTPHLGQHSQVTFYQSLGAPSPPNPPIPTLTAPASVLYSQTTGTSPTAITNLFYSCIQNNVQKYLQLTGLTPVQFTNNLPGSAGGGNGYVLTTPWGITIMWGATASQVQYPAVVFPTALSNSTYALQLTAINQTQPLQEQSANKTTTGFTAKVASGGGGPFPTIEWFVFGVS